MHHDMFFRCLSLSLRDVLSDGNKICGGNGQRCVGSPNLKEWSIWQKNAWDFFEYINVNSRIILKRFLKRLARWVGWIVPFEEECGLLRT
jgi:hypothetical protein